MIPTQLIENALSLTGKTMEDMNAGYVWQWEVGWKFSIEKFCYYLLSTKFMLSYLKLTNWLTTDHATNMYYNFAASIWNYQDWDPEPLISLLEKIWNYGSQKN